MRRCLLLIAVLLVVFAPGGASASKIYTAEVRGSIFTPVSEYLRITLAQAEADGADAVLIEMDTPGGSLDSTKEIVQQILGAAVPVIVYVSPAGGSATSAGTFITLAAHVAAMAPGTTIGAAHPVMAVGGSGGGDTNDDGKPDEHMERKIENYAISFMEAIVGQRGRNVEWAVEAVRDSSSITAAVALEKKVIDLIAPTRLELLKNIDGRTVSVRNADHIMVTSDPEFLEIKMSRQQAFYFFLSQPTVMFVLMLLGAGGIYVEVNNPGLLIPGVVGAICLVLAAIGFSMVPINYVGLLLIVVGSVLIVSELFIPSFGALGIGGMLCLLLGTVLLFDTVETPGLMVPRGVLLLTALSFGGTLFGVGYLVVSTLGARSVSGKEGMIGACGRARQRLAPGGKITVVGEIWEAVLRDGGSVEEGEEVEVVALEGLRVIVVPRGRTAVG